MTTLTAKQKKIIRDAVHADNITFKADGSIVFKRAYFYRMGASSESFAERVVKNIETSTNFKVASVEHTDKWAAWPRTSYFVATIRIA